MGHRSREHEASPTDQRLGLYQQVLGHLDAVLRSVFVAEFGKPLPNVLGDVYTGDLMGEELRLAAAPQGHELQEGARRAISN